MTLTFDTRRATVMSHIERIFRQFWAKFRAAVWRRLVRLLKTIDPFFATRCIAVPTSEPRMDPLMMRPLASRMEICPDAPDRQIHIIRAVIRQHAV